jgi:hypothetical protein
MPSKGIKRPSTPEYAFKFELNCARPFCHCGCGGPGGCCGRRETREEIQFDLPEPLIFKQRRRPGSTSVFRQLKSQNEKTRKRKYIRYFDEPGGREVVRIVQQERGGSDSSSPTYRLAGVQSARVALDSVRGEDSPHKLSRPEITPQKDRLLNLDTLSIDGRRPMVSTPSINSALHLSQGKLLQTPSAKEVWTRQHSQHQK